MDDVVGFYVTIFEGIPSFYIQYYVFMDLMVIAELSFIETFSILLTFGIAGFKMSKTFGDISIMQKLPLILYFLCDLFLRNLSNRFTFFIIIPCIAERECP